MTPARALGTLTLLVLINGCAILNPKGDSFSGQELQINRWIQEKQYGLALKALNRIDPKDPHYTKAAGKRKSVMALAANYELTVQQRAQQSLNEGDWEAALDTYDEALERLPDSVALRDGLAKLHHKQQAELQRLELNRLLALGHWLEETLPIYRDTARVAPRSNEAQQELARIQHKATDVANNLAMHGNRALASSQLEKAGTLFELAVKLSDAPVIAEGLEKIEAHQARAAKQARSERNKRRQRQEAAERHRQKTVARLTQQFEKAYAEKELLGARAHLQALAVARLDTGRYQELLLRLEKAIDKEAARQFELGVNAYSRGQFKEAASHWQQTLALQPENKQAKEHLERAERVLKKLDELKTKQGQ